MAKKTSTIQSGQNVVHTQTIMGALVPIINSIAEEAIRPRIGQPTKRTDAILDEIWERLECGEGFR